MATLIAVLSPWLSFILLGMGVNYSPLKGEACSCGLRRPTLGD